MTTGVAVWVRPCPWFWGYTLEEVFTRRPMISKEAAGSPTTYIEHLPKSFITL